ncbi:MAG TPA: hypothetical protein VFC47_10085, partial [Caulobacteraceae bacterium]|nr:hypothetical protein [Caulobacteraceae bacterium]
FFTSERRSVVSVVLVKPCKNKMMEAIARVIRGLTGGKVFDSFLQFLTGFWQVFDRQQQVFGASVHVFDRFSQPRPPELTVGRKARETTSGGSP